jgi:cyclophilin family peptidyl-prolyl cis-trans isomerase
MPWQIKTNLYNAVMSILPFYYNQTKNATRWQIEQAMKQDSNVYAQMGYIAALGNDPESYPLIVSYLESQSNPIAKTAAVEALGNIVAHKDFNAIYKNVSSYHRKRILDIFVAQMESGDEGIVGAASTAIANEKALLKNLVDSTNFLLEAKEKLKMPQHVESIHAVERALAHIRGVSQANLSEIETYKPVNWALLNEYNEDTKAIIKTNKGAFTIDLYLSEAPGAVLNFIDLANADFYDGKVFHRVVPNFVIQTGSPRGDSYGGADYVIRSEFSPLYYNDEGYVGMASAGRHTESTQWFVTHSATPHLDGKYTIFGKISEGMDVVHNIQVGDIILDVIISNI